jgi:hypothetical protein
VTMMSSMIMQSSLLKCKTKNISNEEGVPRAELLGSRKSHPSKPLQRTSAKKKDSENRTAKKKEILFYELESGAGLGAGLIRF